jgi:hypothetical protein
MPTLLLYDKDRKENENIGVHTKRPLPSNDKGEDTQTASPSYKPENLGRDTQTDVQQGDLISLFLFFKIKKVDQKSKKVKSLSLIKHHAMKWYWGVEVQLHHP